MSRTYKKGFVLIFVLVILAGLSLIVFAYISMVSYEMRIVGAGLSDMRAFYIAEAGRAKARWAITAGLFDVGWSEPDIAFGGGTYTVTTAYSDPPDNQYVTIISNGYIPDSINPIARRTVIEKDIPFTPGGGINLSLASNGTQATSSLSKDDPSVAIDGLTNTKWSSSVNASSWIALDYGSAKTVSRVVVSGSKITSIVVQYSDNGIDWTAVSNPLGSLPGTQTFTSVTARYLKLVITSGAKQKAVVNEFESYTNPEAGSIPSAGKGSFLTFQ